MLSPRGSRRVLTATRITQDELTQQVHTALTRVGFAADDATAITTEFVSAELAGVQSHGVGKLLATNFGDIAAAVHVPGDRQRGEALLSESDGKTLLDIPQSILDGLTKMANGEPPPNPLFN